MKAIRKKLMQNSMIVKVRGFCERMKTYVGRSFSGSEIGLMLVSYFVSGLVVTGIILSCFPTVSWIVCGLVSLILILLGFKLLCFILKLIFGSCRRNVIHWTLMFIFVLLCSIVSSQANFVGSQILLSVAISVGIGLFGRSTWALFVRKNHTVLTGIVLVISTTSLVASFLFLLGTGWRDEYVSRYLKLANERKLEEVTEFDLQGTRQVDYFDYGVEEGMDIHSKTIDISPFASRDFLTGFMMEKHFGYKLSEVPLVGRVWYPVKEKDCPVIFMIHGNHTYTTQSYLGYDYLGKYLASNGYVVVSIDENACNSLEKENDARAILLLENIKFILQQNKEEKSMLFEKIDKQQIGLAGHSRGGEAVALAYLFNDYNQYPENGAIPFHYHFQIRSILAIAPCVDQYTPAQHEVAIHDVNYLMIQGANDHDVSRTMGEKQYQNISFSGEGNYLKSMLYVARANHGQFNTKWGRYDLSFPVNQWINVKNLIPQSEQQDILKMFSKVFFDVTLKNNKTNERLLTDYQKYSQFLPKTIYQQTYQSSHFDCFCDFQEDSNLSTGTKDGVSIHVTGTKKWRELRRTKGNDKSGENYVLEVEWNQGKTAKICYTFPDYDMSQKTFQFDLADARDEVSSLNTLVDGDVTLIDNGGNQAEVRIVDGAVVYPSLPVQLRKSDYLFEDHEMKHAFQTVSLKQSLFQLESESFDWTKVVEVQIAFDNGCDGKIQMDNVGFEED